MANERALPSLISRLQIDTSDLPKAEARAKAFSSQITTSFTGSKKSAEEFEKGLGLANRSLGEAGKVTESLTGRLTQLSGFAGLGGAGIAAAGLTAAVGAGVFAAKEAIGTYVGLVGKVAEFQRVSGASADTSSRLVETFEQLGVSSETASAAVFKLAHRIDTDKKSFDDLGIAVAKTKDGQTDYTETLFNVIDAYNATDDAAQKNKIAYTAFGRSAADLTPILIQNADRLRELEREAKNVFTQEDIDKVREFNREQKELGQSWDHLQSLIGQKLVPGLDRILIGLNEMSAGHFAETWEQYRDKTSKAADAADRYHQEIEGVAQGLKDQKKASDDLLKTTEDVTDATLNVRDADRRVSDALSKLITDQGQASTSAADLQRDQDEVERSMIGAAKSAADLAEKQANLAGTSLTARDKVDNMISKLREEEGTLAPGSPLRNALDQYIAQLDKIPREVNTRITSTISESVIAVKEEGRQHGGTVIPGRIYDIGETGPEKLYMYPGGGGMVVPNVNANVTATLDSRDLARNQRTTNELLAMIAQSLRSSSPGFSTDAYSGR
jgi:hypothetical protein